jgi:hypothetical protein
MSEAVIVYVALWTVTVLAQELSSIADSTTFKLGRPSEPSRVKPKKSSNLAKVGNNYLRQCSFLYKGEEAVSLDWIPDSGAG